MSIMEKNIIFAVRDARVSFQENLESIWKTNNLYFTIVIWFNISCHNKLTLQEIFTAICISVLSYYNIELVCYKCGVLNNRISNLKSVRDMLKVVNNTCKSCGISLNPLDFVINAERRYEKFV